MINDIHYAQQAAREEERAAILALLRGKAQTLGVPWAISEIAAGKHRLAQNGVVETSKQKGHDYA